MLVLNDIFFGYTDQSIINGVTLRLEQGHHLAVIGESGCGKSTLLKIIYGLYDLNAGTIDHNGVPVLGPKFNLVPGMDIMKYLAQDFDLMPFITVAENIGKFLSNFYKDQKKARVAELLEMVEMTAFATTKVQHLSGGQQQRVALARVLALEPRILLLDEPFSQIDTFRRNSLRRNLFRYLKSKNITCIVATHDTTDILGFADSVAVMKQGRIVRLDTPQNLYDHPETYEIAALLDEVSAIPARLLGNDESDETLLLFPHQLKIVAQSRLQPTVVKSYYKGNGYLVESVHAQGKVFFESPQFFAAGTIVSLAQI